MDHLGTDGLLTAVSELPRDDRWHSLARLAIRDDIYGSLRSLCFDVLAVGEPDETGEEKIAEWEHTNGSRVERARRTLTEIYEDDERDLATLSVAARQIRSMTRTSGTRIIGVTRRGFIAPVPVRWSDIDMYQHVNHATMVTILEEARVPFLKPSLRRRHHHHRPADRRGPVSPTRVSCGWRIRRCR